jgi:hypothetical protein
MFTSVNHSALDPALFKTNAEKEAEARAASGAADTKVTDKVSRTKKDGKGMGSLAAPQTNNSAESASAETAAKKAPDEKPTQETARSSAQNPELDAAVGKPAQAPAPAQKQQAQTQQGQQRQGGGAG